MPLFGGPGYEHALASGLIVPGAAAIATGLEVSRAEAPSPLACVGRGIASGLALAAVSLATALLHGLRVGICDLWGGLSDFLLTAGAGSVLGGLWGALVGELARGRRARVVVPLCLFAPILGIAVSLGRFFTSPMIFAFDPFFGYFSGTLYDTVVEAGTPLLTYRAGSAATVLAAVLGASVLTRAPAGLRLVPLKGDPGAAARLVLAAACALGSAGVTLAGSELGHWQTSSTIAARLSGSFTGKRCDLVLPASVLHEDAALLAKDCDEELASVEKELATRGPERVRAFFFHDAGEKKALMGAGDTYIAKPWRKEVYLQLGGYPHPVLGHELAHVVAGSFGRGPFRVAGAAGGLWPNPGLIEGVAVAASPDDDELSDEQWAHALLDLGTLPPLREVFSFDFFSAPAAKSYTVAGAFVRWLIGRFGTDTLHAWYGGGSLEALTGKSWQALDGEFRTHAKETPLSSEATAYAKARFERPAIFGRKCPHVVDAIRQHADRCKDAHESKQAVLLYDEVLARDPHDWAARFSRAMTRMRLSYGVSSPAEVDEGRRELQALVDDPDVPRTWKDRGLEALSDQALIAGQGGLAGDGYRELARRTLDEDYGRMEEVKALASTSPEGRAVVLALLVGSEARPADMVLATSLLGAWETTGDAPLASYLLGKNLSQRGWRTEGAAHLDRLLDRGAYPSERIGREVIRDRAIDACARGDREAVTRMRGLVTDEKGPYASSVGRKESVLRLLDRCSTD